MKRSLYKFIVLLFGFFLLIINVRLYRPGDTRVVLAQLNYLEDALSNGASETMQAFFPEGYVFTWALYGLASAQVVNQLAPDDIRREHWLAEAWRAVEALRSDQARSPFTQEMSPSWGVFYSSWFLYVLAEYVRAAGAENVGDDVLALLTQEADLLAQAIESNESPFLEAYPNMAWPVDTCVGIAALGIYDATVEPRYEQIIRNWTLKARSLLDDQLGALGHAADPTTGSPLGGIRGGSLALMSRLLVDADPDFAREQYAILRNHFVDYRLGAPGVREYPHGDRGFGDIDSGPIILGFAGPATVVGAGAANVNGDTDLANALLSAVEAGGLSIEVLGKRRYVGGLVPVADAFIVWSRTSSAPSAIAHDDWDRIIPQAWRLPFHFLSIGLYGVMCLRVFRNCQN